MSSLFALSVKTNSLLAGNSLFNPRFQDLLREPLLSRGSNSVTRADSYTLPCLYNFEYNNIILRTSVLHIS